MQQTGSPPQPHPWPSGALAEGLVVSAETSSCCWPSRQGGRELHGRSAQAHTAVVASMRADRAEAGMHCVLWGSIEELQVCSTKCCRALLMSKSMQAFIQMVQKLDALMTKGQQR